MYTIANPDARRKSGVAAGRPGPRDGGRRAAVRTLSRRPLRRSQAPDGGRKDGGESGIRTHEAVLAPTRFPIVLFQPLRHLSATTYRGDLGGCDRICAVSR